MDMIVGLLGFINIFVYLAILGFIVYFLIKTLKLMKEKNSYLKEISENIKNLTNKN
jgi:hypothetical protein